MKYVVHWKQVHLQFRTVDSIILNMPHACISYHTFHYKCRAEHCLTNHSTHNIRKIRTNMITIKNTLTEKRPKDQLTPKQTFDYIFDRILIFELIVGTNYVRDPHFRPNLFTWFWIAYNTSLVFSICYTMIVYDYETKWKSFSILGLVMQGMTKYAVLLLNSDNIYVRIKFLADFYKVNASPSQRSYRILERFRPTTMAVFKVGIVAITGSIFGAFIVPVIEAVYTRTMIPIVEMYLPYVDEKTVFGFTLLMVYDLLGGVLATCGTNASDMLFIMYVVHLKPLVDVFDDNMEQLNEALQLDENKRSIETYRFLRNLLMMHKDICEYETRRYDRKGLIENDSCEFQICGECCAYFLLDHSDGSCDRCMLVDTLHFRHNDRYVVRNWLNAEQW